jgi:hypothetical protein
MNRPVMPPLHAKLPQGTGLVCLVCCVAEEVGYVFVEGADVDPHASAGLRVEGGQEDRGVGLREVPVLECR